MLVDGVGLPHKRIHVGLGDTPFWPAVVVVVSGGGGHLLFLASQQKLQMRADDCRVSKPPTLF